jgi:SNF2 family DNA or RNA helicase
MTLRHCRYVNRFDVCITTYNVLQNDLNVARKPPERPRRQVATYSKAERPRSPLVMVEWYRVIMDEVQVFSVVFAPVFQDFISVSDGRGRKNRVGCEFDCIRLRN